VSEFLRFGITRFAQPQERKRAGKAHIALRDTFGPDAMDPKRLANEMTAAAFDTGAVAWMNQRPNDRGQAFLSSHGLCVGPVKTVRGSRPATCLEASRSSHEPPQQVLRRS
jgi:hypothetical protein